MPSAPIHLYIANFAVNAAGYIHADSFSDFLLGCISPDFVNVNGFAPKKLRYPAHCRDADRTVWLKNISRFLSENQDIYNKDFIRGYAYHLQTDLWWDELAQDALFEKMKRLGIENLNKEKWRYLNDFDVFLCRKKEFKNIYEVLKSAKVPEKLPAGIDTEKAEKYRLLVCSQIADNILKPVPNDILVEEKWLKDVADAISKNAPMF